MGKLCKMVWMGIALFGAYELGRLSKACDRVEEQIINKMADVVAEYRDVKEVK